MAKDFADLLKLAGSFEQIAIDCGIGSFAVYQWCHRTGVPQKHWEALIKKYDLSPAELYMINQSIRKKRK